MSMFPRVFARFGVLLLLAALTAAAMAQMVPLETVESIDLKVMNASKVVLATVEEYTPDPYIQEREVTLGVKETLKGRHAAKLLTNIEGPVERLGEWKVRSSRLLLFSREGHPYAKPGETWFSQIDLDDPDLKVPTADFTVLRDPEKVLRYVRDLVQRHPNTAKVQTFNRKPPDDDVGMRWKGIFGSQGVGGLSVPADERLERWGRSEVRSKSEQRRLEGIAILQLFNNEQNIALMKGLLKDPTYRVYRKAEDNRGIEEREYVIRKAAHETLQWRYRVYVPEPVTRQRISRLDTIETMRFQEAPSASDLELLREAKKLRSLTLHPYPPLTERQLEMIGQLTTLTHLYLPAASVDDTKLKHLSGLKELRVLGLNMNPITDEGLRALTSFPNLTDVSLSETEATDDGLEALRKARPGLRVRPPYAETPIHLYARSGNLEGLRRVLDKSPKALEARDPRHWGYTALHHAASNGQYEVAKLLLDRGAPVDQLTQNKQTALLLASTGYNVNVPLVHLLVSRGANVNHADVEQNTVLHHALRYGQNSAVPFLLATGADPFVKNANFRLPIETEDRINEKVRDALVAFMALKKQPVALLPQTSAICNRIAYKLGAGEKLEQWSTNPSGRLHGPVQWSRSPAGRDYVGPFGQQAVTLKLTDLPKHANVQIEIDLFVIGSWDGNGGLGPAPDLLDIKVHGLGTLLHSTFFNNTEEEAGGIPLQSFPDVYPLGFHKGYTGAAESRSLGFLHTWFEKTYKRDAVYKLRFTIAQSASDLELIFTGQTVTDDIAKTLADDESWGIEKLVVKTD